jgi:predicted transcriptional regulator
MLARLQAKGVVRRYKDGRKYYYAPASGEQAREAALRRLARDHFGGCIAALIEAAAALAEAERPKRLRVVGGR